MRIAAGVEVGQVRHLLLPARRTTRRTPHSCTFTKENTAAKPDMNTPEAQEAGETEEYCENCGRVMVLRRGLFGMFMSCPGYNEDPPCKTIRKLSQKQQQKQTTPQPTGEDCPLCGKPLVLRQGAYGEFVSCSGYPKCKYVKQNLIEGMKCPKCGTGRPGRAQGAARKHLLGLHQLSQVRLHVELQAGGAGSARSAAARTWWRRRCAAGIYLECPNKKKAAEELAHPRSGPEGRQEGAAGPGGGRRGVQLLEAHRRTRLRRPRPRRMGRWWRRRRAARRSCSRRKAKAALRQNQGYCVLFSSVEGRRSLMVAST